ncbi:MAG: histidine kinase, partial [Candidatus Aminicenantes bacterium]|nr:histidine kinase [Candidatus Aminicenantes bacterium]
MISQAQAKVRHDLDAARMVFNSKLKEIKDIVSLTAGRNRLQENIQNKKYNTLLENLSRLREETGLDILTLTDNTGKVIVRTRNPGI